MELASACVCALHIFGGRARRPTGTEDDAEQTGNKQLCLVKYEELDPNTGMRQILVAARSVEGEDTKQTLLFGVATAYTLVMPAGVQIRL